MRLINADGCIKSIEEQARCKTCDNYHGLKCNTCWCDDAVSSIDDYADGHTVDAIPVEWLYDLADKKEEEKDIKLSAMIKGVVALWKMEKREQNDSD